MAARSETVVFSLSSFGKFGPIGLGSLFVGIVAWLQLSGLGDPSSFYGRIGDRFWPLMIAVGVWMIVMGLRNVLVRRPFELDGERLVVRYELNWIRPHVVRRSDLVMIIDTGRHLDLRGSKGLLMRVIKAFLVDPDEFAAQLRSRWPEVRFAHAPKRGGAVVSTLDPPRD